MKKINHFLRLTLSFYDLVTQSIFEQLLTTGINQLISFGIPFPRSIVSSGFYLLRISNQHQIIIKKI